ncbi:hypothetical protein ES703_58755 [subsurface metagenome]
MDDLIAMTKEIRPETRRVNLGARIEPFGDEEESAGQNFAPTGYATDHRNLAEFVRDIKYPSERRVMAMDVGASGGFMVPDQLLAMVLQPDPEVMVVGLKATTIMPFESAPDSPTLIPALDVSGGKGVLGGISMDWIAEGKTKPKTKPELVQIRLEPQEIAGHVVVTDKLIRNAGAEFDIFLRRTLGNALAAAQEQSFLTGDGIGKPLGMLNSPCRIEVPRTGPGGIVYQDLVNMISVFGPDTWAKGFWMISQSALPALLTMPDPGAAGTLIIKPADLRLGTPPSMLGLPTFVSSRIPVLATGDVQLLEPSFYLRKLGSGPFIEASTGPLFKENKTIIKIFANVDGQPWLSSSVLMEDSVSQVSPFILLAA